MAEEQLEAYENGKRTDELPIVLVTIGDPAGSGPELAVKTALEREVQRRCHPLVIGAPQIIEDALHRLGKNQDINYVEESFLLNRRSFAPNELHVFPVGSVVPREYDKGKPSAVAGQHAIDITRTAAQMALRGLADALCTAPSSKVSLHLAGYDYSGISDLLREVTNAGNYETMIILSRIRIVQATSHVPFRSVPILLKRDRIIGLIETLESALVSLFEIANPRIAVAALNPHGGEGGLYGNEELDVLIPAVEVGKQSGISVSGPVPADSLIPRMQLGDFDGAVMLYHDQAYIPLKALGWVKPATLLLGLPIIRTSVAHGTAYGKAMSGTASPSGMIHAILLAADLGSRKRAVLDRSRHLRNGEVRA